MERISTDGLKQFILGFPDRDEVILSPPANPFVQPDLSNLISSQGTVVATLKPSGKVEIAGIEYSATTADGMLLDPGMAIRVSDVRNTILIVRSV